MLSAEFVSKETSKEDNDVREVTEITTIKGSVEEFDTKTKMEVKEKRTKEHRCLMHTDRSKNTSESNLFEKCNFIAPSANAFKGNIESHTPDAFSWTQCDHRTKNSKLIERHVIRQHESRNLLLCNQCDFTTKFRSYISL